MFLCLKESFKSWLLFKHSVFCQWEDREIKILWVRASNVWAAIPSAGHNINLRGCEMINDVANERWQLCSTERHFFCCTFLFISVLLCAWRFGTFLFPLSLKLWVSYVNWGMELGWENRSFTANTLKCTRFGGVLMGRPDVLKNHSPGSCPVRPNN